MASKPQGNLLGRIFSGQNRKVNIQELTAEKMITFILDSQLARRAIDD